MDEQRALLDQLMGLNRNNDQKKKELEDYTDDKVCKFYLSGYYRWRGVFIYANHHHH